MVDHISIFWLGNADETLEIKQLLNIYRDLQLGHFCAFYQPQKHIDSGGVVAFEALARRVIGKGLYEMPDRFFPILEKYHLIPTLTEVMVRDILTF